MKDRRIDALAVAASVLLSVWLLYWDGVINVDGVLYIDSAKAMVAGDWDRALEIYRWPLFSILIALVHQITGVAFDVAGYAINTVLYAVAVWAYLAIVRELKADARTMMCAAVFILVLPAFNEYRSFIIRDVGFWTFYLCGLLSLLRYLSSQAWRHAIAWGASMVVATLFRIEGMVFLTLLPLVVFRHSPAGWRGAARQFLQLQAVALVLLAAGLAWASTQEQFFTGRLYEPLQMATQFMAQLSGGLQEKADAIREHVFLGYSTTVAGWGVLALIIGLLLSYLIPVSSVLGLAAAFYALWRRVLPASNQDRAVLLLTAGLNFAILIVFIVIQFFMGSRYVMPFALLVALVAPFGLSHLQATWLERRRASAGRRKEAIAFAVAILLLVAMAVDSLWSFGPTKTHLKQAGKWLAQHTPAEARILSNSSTIVFYADREGSRVSSEEDEPEYQSYNFVALALGKSEAPPEALNRFDSPVSFVNNKNDRVVIFRIP